MTREELAALSDQFAIALLDYYIADIKNPDNRWACYGKNDTGEYTYRCGNDRISVMPQNLRSEIVNILPGDRRMSGIILHAKDEHSLDLRLKLDELLITIRDRLC